VNSAYADYLQTIGEKFTSLIREIRADYNFDLGDEFEIAVCKALRFILPTKYGVCRGTVFNIDNQSVGDDIIIFDQWRFPVLRLLDDNNYAQKQRIPVEAVVAYIEAKNTLILEDGHGNSLSKAIEQTTAIKKLGRKEMPLNPFVMDINMNGLDITAAKDFPQINNPFYTCIFSRGVRAKPNEQPLDSTMLYSTLLSFNQTLFSSDGHHADSIVFNSDVIIFPAINNKFRSPFWTNNTDTHYAVFNCGNMAWGVGISLLFFAFENIWLGSMGWQSIIGKTLNIKTII